MELKTAMHCPTNGKQVIELSRWVQKQIPTDNENWARMEEIWLPVDEEEMLPDVSHFLPGPTGNWYFPSLLASRNESVDIDGSNIRHFQKWPIECSSNYHIYFTLHDWKWRTPRWEKFKREGTGFMNFPWESVPGGAHLSTLKYVIQRETRIISIVKV